MKSELSRSDFVKSVCALAVPVALQSMLQSSFGAVDQIMIGQLGDVAVAGVGLAGKLASVCAVLLSAVGTVAGIMLSQYLGQKNRAEVRRSFRVNLALSLLLALVFTLPCALAPRSLMRLYSTDERTVASAAEYLRIVSGTFLPLAFSSMLCVLLRCLERAKLPLYASLASALLNTALNYVLIFGKAGFPALGARGAAIATLASQLFNLLVLLLLSRPGEAFSLRKDAELPRFDARQYLAMLLPVLVCELAWSLGENVYAAIYARIDTQSSAAMTLINPVQGMMTGALCGLSQAAGVIVGKRLGSGDRDGAYGAARSILFLGVIFSLPLCVLIAVLRGAYSGIYQVDDRVRELTCQILLVYAFVAPFKVQNMILGGGILRSGGATKYVMVIDIVGTWAFGVPLGLLSSSVLRLSVAYVYLFISLEECVRFAVSLVVFKRKRWMRRL